MGHIEAAKKINEDGIDILIDLKGHTKDNRLEIMALKPAPIQITWLGFPGTTGSSFIDYIITDKIVTPPSSQKFYSEKFLYMPNSYQINYDKRKIQDAKFTRQDFGLPQKAFVFSSFNHTSKIDPETYFSWTNILNSVPNSVLWLLRSNKMAEKNLQKYAKTAGVNPNRIIFSDTVMPNEWHLARLKLSDLALDTFIYNGHTTTSDSLWAGVPVVTLLGKHFASRVAASLLTAVGLPELITHSQKEYENLAIKIANDNKLNARLKSKLISNKLTSPLFNTKLFVENLEKLYTKIYESRI
jgi:predicted O-linked N-acetylglucosamine transferase (SPINDLY family)